MAPNLEPQDSTPGEIQSVSVLVARVTWIMLGPLALLALAYGIVVSGSGWLTLLDAAFCVVASLMLLGRWVEQRSGAATTLEGEPSTPRHLHRYVKAAIPVTAAVWVAANLVGNHVLNQA